MSSWCCDWMNPKSKPSNVSLKYGPRPRAASESGPQPAFSFDSVSLTSQNVTAGCLMAMMWGSSVLYSKNTGSAS